MRQFFGSELTLLGLSAGESLLMVVMVELALYGRDLPEVDRFSSSDPFCLVCVEKQGEWRPVGRTETVWDEPNPDFAKKIQLPYSTEQEKGTVVMLKLYDNDASKKKRSKEDDFSAEYLKKQNFLGSLKFPLSVVVESPQHFESFELDGCRGSIMVHANVVKEEQLENKHISVKMDATPQLKGRRKLFAIVSQALEGSSLVGPRWTPLWRSECHSYSSDGIDFGAFWTTRHKCLRLDIFEYHRKGGHGRLAHCEVPMDDESTSAVVFTEATGLSRGTLLVGRFGSNLVSLRLYNLS